MNEKNGQNEQAGGTVEVAEKPGEQAQTPATQTVVPVNPVAPAPEVKTVAKATKTPAKKAKAPKAATPAPTAKPAPKAAKPPKAKREPGQHNSPYGRLGTLTNAVYDVGHRKFQTKEEMVECVLAKMKADGNPVKATKKSTPEKLVGMVIDWMRVSPKTGKSHKTNAGRFNHLVEQKDGKNTDRFKIVSLITPPKAYKR
jgi:outer membrane biosynthesis protein TonB